MKLSRIFQSHQLEQSSEHYELGNHLGNVLAVVTDNIHMADDLTTTAVASASDYYPFGLQMDSRTVNEGDYRYGFNGKEKDQDGEFGNTHYDYGFRTYNPAIAKFLSVDPLTSSYPMLTPYQFASNRPIDGIDLDGLEYLKANEAKVTVIQGTAFIKLENFSSIYQNRWWRENPDYGFIYGNADGTARGIGEIGKIIQPDPEKRISAVLDRENYGKTQLRANDIKNGKDRLNKADRRVKNFITINSSSARARGAGAGFVLMLNAVNFTLETHINVTMMEDQNELYRQTKDRRKLEIVGFFKEEWVTYEAPLNKAINDVASSFDIILPKLQTIGDVSMIINIVLYGGEGNEPEEIQKIGAKIIDDVCKCRKEDVSKGN
jgi:RHS repeat-associated protein